MRDGLTGDDLFAQLILLRVADERTIVLLEGESDCRALDPHIDADSAYTLPGHSKSVVERVITLVDARGMQRVLGVLDRDWVGLLDTPLNSRNVVYTDDYDLDATIFFCGDCFARVVSNVTDRNRLNTSLERTGCSAKEIAERLAGTVGVARFISRRDGLDINLRGFPIEAAVDANEATVDIEKLALIAVRRSVEARATDAVVAERLRAALASQPDLRRFCNGHDLAAASATMIRKSWGGTFGAEQVARALRAALSCADLHGMVLFRAVHAWADSAGTQVWNCG